MNAKTKVVCIILCCAFLLLSLAVHAQENDQSILTEAIEKRKALAESGRFLYQSPSQQFSVFEINAASVSLAEALAGALDVASSILVNASVSGSSTASGVFAGLGVIQPKQGPTFTLLSSGVAGTSQPEPGVDFPPQGTAGDRVTLTLTLNLPAGTNRLSFDFNFLTAESPDFIGTSFNDTFTAVLTDSNGIREIARASVNSSAFFPVSASRAGGSGFDIFTEDPSGVDTEFGGGLPDAGLTGFKSVNVSVAAGGMVVLEFTIEDRGDGILDSAVILDNLVVSSLEVVDPNPVFLSDGEIVGDPESLAQGGEQRDTAAADGVTRVLLRNRVSGPGTVKFCLVDGSAPEDGGLTLVGGTGGSNCVNAPVVDTSQGFIAFAIYRTPNEFNRGGDEALAERPLRFSARFTPTTGDTTESEFPFKLVRPPVVLVHGLWSGGGTWMFPLVGDPRFMITIADYQATNASHFATNLFVPFDFIRESVTRARLNNIAATQVDIAGHSMGGILSRNYIATAIYERSNNFNAGDVHKFVTLNTPHTGSPLGNLLQLIRAIPIVGSLFESAMAAIGHPVDLGAIEDLAKGSAAINAIQQTPVPSHALVGIGGSDALELIPGRIGAIYTVINFFADSSDLFQGLQHDAIVGRQSQEGGLPVNAFTVFDGFESIHIFVTGSSNYSNRLIELWNSPASGPLFAEFPAPISIASSASLVALQTAVLLSASPAFSVASQYLAAMNDLVISSPLDGTVVTAGDTVLVVVDPPSAMEVTRVLLIGPGVALVDDEAPFEFDLPIPIEAVGAFEISVVGSDNNGNFVGSNVVTLQVVPSVVLESIRLIPMDPILLAIGETRTLTVLGTFSDGIVRNITSSTTGTEYLASNPEIVSVSSQGVVTSVAPGVATVVARNEGIQDSVSVTVFLENRAPIANAGPDQTVQTGSLVTLNGAASSDPDEGPGSLVFEWLQTAGVDVFLVGATTSTPTFTPLGAGSYTFSLVVRDGQTDSEPDSVTITATGLVLGDLNGDGCVDRADYDILITDIRDGEPNTPAHDLNNDGVVNRADARTLIGLFTNPQGASCN